MSGNCCHEIAVLIQVKACYSIWAWWRHQMKTFSTLLALYVGNPPVTSEFPSQRPVTRSFDVFFICTWLKGWANNREAGDLRCHRAHYDVIIMSTIITADVITPSPFAVVLPTPVRISTNNELDFVCVLYIHIFGGSLSVCLTSRRLMDLKPHKCHD